MNELFLQFKLNGVDIVVKKEEKTLSFEAKKEDKVIPLNVVELVQYKMYKFNVFDDTCIIGFDNDDNICLHIIKGNNKEHIYYSLSEDDKNMYTMDEIKKMYKYNCETMIQTISDNFDELVESVSEMHFFKNVSFKKVKNKLYKELDTLVSLYRIELYEAQYIQDIKEANDNTINKAREAEKKFVKELKQIIYN